MAGRKPSKKPRLRWWQLVCRVAAAAVVVGAAAYVSLPWWAPTGAIRRHLAGQMARQLGVDVRIAALSLSWSEGVVLEGLTVDSPEGFGPAPLLHVRTIRTDLSPIRLLLHRRLARMELVEPTLAARVDANGNVNLRALKNLTFDVETDHVSVRRGRATLRLPNDRRVVALDVRDLQFEAGRIGQVGLITMSAALAQSARAGEAPVSLSPWRGDPDVATAVSFSFANVDLDQLPLSALLGLPVKKLAGRCSGSLHLKVNHQGVMEGFRLDVRIRRLDVQPADGPKLPVIDEAGFQLAAAYDHLTHAIEVRSGRVRLPGMDLTGQAKVFTELLAGHGEAIESLDLSGKLYPARLAVVLTGKPLLPGGLTVTGAVNVALKARREGPRLRLGAEARATDAVVRRGRAVLKPAGRSCRADLAGTFDHRSSRFVVEQGEMTLAGNRFYGRGALDDLRRLIRRLTDRRKPLGPDDVLAALAGLNWQGSWEIRDVQPLHDLLGQAPAAWKELSLAGELTGRWSIRQEGSTRIHASLEAPPETQLALAGCFAKPRGASASLDLDATLDANAPGLRDVAAELTYAAARVRVDRAQVAVRERPGRTPTGARDHTLRAAGRIAAENVEALLACCPMAEDLHGHLRGGLAGRFELDLAPDRQTVAFTADLKETAVAFERSLVKPAGRPHEIAVTVRTDPSAPPTRRIRAELVSRTPQADVRLTCLAPELPAGLLPNSGSPPPAAASRPGRDAAVAFSAEADVRDVRWLTETFPVLADPLARAKLSGSLRLSAAGHVRDGALDANALCDARDLAFASGADREAGAAPAPARAKARGVPLTLRLAFRLAGKDEHLAVDVRSGRVVFADSRVDFRGSAKLRRTRAAPAGKPAPPPRLDKLHLDANATVGLGPSVCRALPEVRRAVDRHGLAGRLAARITLDADPNSIRLRSHLHATDLAAANLLPAAPRAASRGEGRDGPGRPAAGTRGPAWLARLGPVVKPAGLPAEAHVDLACPSDLSRVRLLGLQVRLGRLSVVADAAAPVQRDRDGSPTGLGTVAAHVAVSTTEAGELVRLLPALEPYAPRGSVFVEAELPDVVGGLVSLATVELKRLRVRYKDRDVTLNGRLVARQIAPPPARSPKGSLPAIDHLTIDALEFRAGKNHGWLVADLRSLPAKAAGRFHLLAEHFDDRDLSEWLFPRDPNLPPPTVPGKPWKLTEPEARRLRDRARKLLARGRNYLSTARLDGRVSLRRLRTHDKTVDRTYEVRRLELAASVDRGVVKVVYRGGLNGGLVHGRYAVDLKDAVPRIACEGGQDKILPDDDFQPQLAKSFPGNTVDGLFTRQERTEAPLVEMLAAALDGRYPLRPVGTAKTVAVEGVTQGRAAPEFVARIFPGLNLAKYRYRKMTAFQELRSDGTAVNDMVFDGKTYDLYMEGVTDADHIGRYEIGLILLGSPQSAEWNHTYRQGRIPILNFKARIEGGKMHDEEVSYLWPNETLFVIFLKNNIFYRIWLAADKTRTGP